MILTLPSYIFSWTGERTVLCIRTTVLSNLKGALVLLYGTLCSEHLNFHRTLFHIHRRPLT